MLKYQLITEEYHINIKKKEGSGGNVQLGTVDMIFELSGNNEQSMKRVKRGYCFFDSLRKEEIKVFIFVFFFFYFNGME